MLGILVSRADDASVHIGEHLLDLEVWDEETDTSRPDADGGGTVYRTDGAVLREFDGLHLDLQRPADAYADLDVLVFASKHAGETGPLLTAHHTGNAGPADHGGDPNDLARACPNAHARVIDALESYAPEGYEVGMECTHHGPSKVGAPSMFVEVGSAQPQWDDSEATRAVAKAILELRGVAPDRESEGHDSGMDGEPDRRDPTRRHIVGVGGGHYAPRFERIDRETGWAVGHVIADWGLDALGDLDEAESQTVLAQALDESRAAYALVDGDRPEVAAAVESAGGHVVGETWVRETGGVPLPFVRRVEQAVGTVADGVRFGDPAEGYDDDFAVVSLPVELLDETRGIDREATRAALQRESLAFVTDQGGTRVAGPAVVADRSDRERIVDHLVAVLDQRYDEVERAGEEIVARESAFVPERARTLGIPEGPKFGRLADGQPVEVDGERIPPEAVRETRERRFQLAENDR